MSFAKVIETSLLPTIKIPQIMQLIYNQHLRKLKDICNTYYSQIK